MPTVRPLTNNPLRPSGPIRRTCGVIKLPVIFVAPPTDDEVKNDVMSAPVSLPAHPVGLTKPLEASKPPQPVPTAVVTPVGSRTAELVVPAMWENRLVGVKPCDHETGMEIVVTVNKPQNGMSICGAGALPEAVNGGELNSSNVAQNSTTLQSLIKQQQLLQQQKKTANLMATLTQAQASLPRSTTSPQQQQQQNLIQSFKAQQQKHLVSTAATLLPQPNVVLASASLTNLLRQQQQQQQQNHHGGSVSVTVTSGRTMTTSINSTMTTSINSTAVGCVSSIGMAATGTGRLPHQEGGRVGAGARLSSGLVQHSGVISSQQGGHLTGNDLIKLSLTAGAASSTTNPFVSSSSISNGPTSMNIDGGEDAGASVSDSEIRLQEEKVRQLRQQLLAAAAQVAAAKGSAVV